MAINNSGFATSEKRRHLTFSNFNLAAANGETGVLQIVPFAGTLDSAQIAFFNISSNPSFMLTASRFIVGQGFTSWNIGSTFAIPAFGTSGVLASGISLPASGSTLLQLMKNDVIGYAVGGSGSVVGGMCGDLVINAIQDVKTNLYSEG